MMQSVWPVLPLLGEWVLRLVFISVILLRRRPNPAVTLTWIIVILVFPFIGLIFYLLVGEARLGRKRTNRHKEIMKRLHASAPAPKKLLSAAKPVLKVRDRQIASLGEAVRGHMPLGGNDIELISDTDAYIQHMIEDIEQASHHCHLLFYIYLADDSGHRLGKALMAAAERGVACRLLVDSVGSKHFLRSSLARKMIESGVQVVGALPASVFRMLFARADLRNHRKIAIMDGQTAYTGSQNIACASFAPKAAYAPWYDVSVKIRGPVVRDLQTLFIEDWYLDSDEMLDDVLAIEPPISDHGVPAQIIGTGPDSYNEALRQLLQSSLNAAQEEVILTTPYFVPDEGTTIALCTAARRGVDTHLVVPARNDSPIVALASRSYYEVLLDSGVHLHEFKPGLLHAKTITVDRDLAVVSTANLDRRSFELNFEVSLIVYNSDFASRLRFMQRSYISHSKVVNARQWRERGWASRLSQNAAGILSPLL
jgi:cardiolipin synthase